VANGEVDDDDDDDEEEEEEEEAALTSHLPSTQTPR